MSEQPRRPLHHMDSTFITDGADPILEFSIVVTEQTRPLDSDHDDEGQGVGEGRGSHDSRVFLVELETLDDNKRESLHQFFCYFKNQLEAT